MTNVDDDRPRASLARRLHALSGVVPLGIFLVVHLVANASAMSGSEAYARIARPIAFPIALVAIYAPLAFHALYGTWMVIKRERPLVPHPNERILLLQRIASFVLLAFLAFHVWTLRLWRVRTGADPLTLYTRLTEHLSWTWGGIPVVSVVYVFGLAAAAFHLAYGIWTFTRPTARRTTLALSWAGVLLFLLGTGTVICATTGSRFLPALSSGPTPPPCPPPP